MCAALLTEMMAGVRGAPAPDRVKRQGDSYMIIRVQYSEKVDANQHSSLNKMSYV